MTYRKIYNLEKFSGNINNILIEADILAKSYDLEPNHYFKKDSYYHPASISKESHDGSFEAIPNRLIRKSRPVLEAFKGLEDDLGITGTVLTRYITRFHPGDFLEWRKREGSIGKYLLISTTNCKLQFQDETIFMNPNKGIMYKPDDIHAVKDVADMQNFIVFMISDYYEGLQDYEINF